MKPAFLILLSLLSASSAAAQNVDVAVSITAQPIEARLVAGYGVHVNWQGADAPQNAVLDADLPAPIAAMYPWDVRQECTTEGTHIRCTLPADVNFNGGFYVETHPAAPGTYTATATVTSTTPDPNPANNQASAAIEVLGLPLLRPDAISIDAERENVADPARPASLRGGIQNVGETATNVVLHMTLPDGGTFTGIDYYLGPPAECTTTPAEIVCHWAELAWEIGMQFQANFIAPDRDEGGTFRVRFDVTADQADADPEGRTYLLEVPLRKRFHVTTSANDGAGSLRQAILDATAQCASTPCLIAFRTEETIRPTTPLPHLSGFLKIDGFDRRVEIDGSLLPAGEAFFGNVCDLRIAHLGIRNFPGHAIETYDSPACSPRFGYDRVGVFIRHNELTGNLRGVVSKGTVAFIEDNVIRASRRAGIFVDGGSLVQIKRNDISQNGASGVFVNLSEKSAFYTPPYASLMDNTITGNAEWGVCRTRRGYVEVRGNTITGNRYLPLDVDLDFESPNREDDRGGVPNRPEIFSATYDPARNVTIVRGRLDTQVATQIDLYASTRPGDVEHFLKSVYSFNPDFEAVIDGDLRGQWINAASNRWFVIDLPYEPVDTSEVSNAVQVQ